MSDPSAPGDTLSSPTSPSSKRLRLADPRLVVAVVAVATGLALVKAAVWWTHPRVFGGHGDGFEADPVPVTRAVLHVGVTFPPVPGDPEAVLTLRAAHASVPQDSAGTEITFWVCHPGKDDDPVLAVRGDLRRYCRSLQRLGPGTPMRQMQGARAYVVMTLRPTRPGVVRVDRVDLDYALGADHLWQRGTEPIRLDVTDRAA